MLLTQFALTAAASSFGRGEVVIAMWPFRRTTANSDTELLAEQIEATLRRFVKVPRLNPDSLVARPGFWQRCELIEPVHYSIDSPLRRIFVDGFAGACQWNAWKVYKDALAPELSLWSGYACYGGAWYGHSWCRLRGHVIETTAPFRLYFGAALTADEIHYFAERFGKFDLESRKCLYICTFKNGTRTQVPYDSNEHAHSIGRERDWKTDEIKVGLGR